MEEGKQQLGRTTNVKVQVHEVAKDGLSWVRVGVARHYNENRVPVLGYTLVLLKTMKSVVDMIKYHVLKFNAFVSHSIDSLGIEDFL